MANTSPDIEDQTRKDVAYDPRATEPEQFVASEESRGEEPAPTAPETGPSETAPIEQESPPEQPESQPAPETPEIDASIQSLSQKIRVPKKAQPSLPQIADALTLQVEKIMSEGLSDAYHSLTPIQQQTFKLKGEETAQQIRHLLSKTRVKIKHIFRLLLEWLKLLPRINVFFLEQEAKIKADRILALKKLYDTRQ